MSNSWGAKTTWDGEELPLSHLTKMHDLSLGIPVHALDARVLAYMDYQDQIISTLNADWVPEYPIITDAGVLKHDNGLWGGYKYSQWPQFFSKHAFHHTCIPFHKDLDTWIAFGEDLMWYKLCDFDFVDDSDMDLCTDETIRLLSTDLVDKLKVLLDSEAAAVHSVGQKANIDGMRKVYNHCLSSARTALNNLRLQKSSFHAILFTICDVQQAILKLCSLHMYLDEVVKHMKTPNKMWQVQSFLLPIHSAFTTEPAVAENLYWLGIPMWYISAEKAVTPNMKIFDVQNCVPWMTHMSKEYIKYKGSLLLFGLNFDLKLRMRDMAASQLMNNNHMSHLLNQMYNFQFFAPPPKPFSHSHAMPAASTSNHNDIIPSLPAPAQPSPATLKWKKGGMRRKISNEPSVNYTHVLYVPKGVDRTPDLPPVCSTVCEALKDLGTVGDESSPAALYPLPPPFFLVHESPEKSADLYLNYICIRPVLFDILINGGLFDKTVWWKLWDWRNILHRDYKKSMPLPPNTVSPFIEGMYKSLPEGSCSLDTLQASHYAVDVSNLPLAKWQHVAVNAAMKVTFGVK